MVVGPLSTGWTEPLLLLMMQHQQSSNLQPEEPILKTKLKYRAVGTLNEGTLCFLKDRLHLLLMRHSESDLFCPQGGPLKRRAVWGAQWTTL